jgi:hypothetical protein
MEDINKITINPRIIEILLKILYFRYDEEDYSLAIGPLGVEVLLSLGLSERATASLKDFLRKIEELENTKKGDDLKNSVFALKKEENRELMRILTTKDVLKIAKEVLKDRAVKQLEYDNWNVYGDYVKYWRQDLIDALRENGFIFDENSNEFLYSGNLLKITFEPIIEGEFIKTHFEDQLYENLKREINAAYSHGFFTVTLILSRKLIENLLIDVLRKKYPPSGGGLSMYYNENTRHFLYFSDLVNNLENHKEDFKAFEDVVNEILSLINELRETANAGAHSIVFYSDRKSIDELKIPHLIDLLVHLYERT